ncbi:MAG TPA: hypothetical protein VNO20_02560 [Solirubrobacterales bacterium]|nr:hypothetical protein [Solirubrobacterales bacterium]
MTFPRRTILTLVAALALGVSSLGVAACGYESDEKEVVEGEPVTLGEVKYNVVFSRFLNPNDTEDSAYLLGQPPPPKGSSYFGVFFEVQNEHDEPQPLPDSFTIHDAEHTAYDSIESESLYAFPLGGEVEAEEQVPVLDSTAFQGPIEGSLVLFLLPDTVSSNRPLVLEIEGPDGPGEVSLDL